ncbi:MAG: hypothetical protein E2O38_12320 [Proteobacteria bacterium]|nr:MAG: hypothetical protein E2O38_12320 [Pseudomonadota bacterium]
MREIDFFDDESGATVFRDVILLALAGFVMLVLLLLPHLNPRATPQDPTPRPGNVMVELRWPDELNVDVDLWVQAPGDVPVGYSNQGGAIFNLLRDDLGHINDATDLNYEFSYSRGVPAGEYTVNLHLYRNLANVYPVPAVVAVSVKNSPNLPAQQILSTKLNLSHEDQELTAFRFKLDEEGRLLSGSVHNLPRPLRAAARR